MSATEDLACWMDCRDRYQFETTLAELSIRFINLPADRVDSEIVEAQRRVCECLDLELSVLWQLAPEAPEFLLMTHLYRPLGGPPVPERMLASEYFPWAFAQVMAGRHFVVPSMAEIPKGAERDAEVWVHYGLRNAVAFPLAAGGGATFGAVSFHDVTKTRTWSKSLIKRLESVAGVFASAIARNRSEQALRESEERLLLATEAAESGLWALNAAGDRLWVTAKIMELFGLPPGDGMDFEAFIALVHPDDRVAMRSAIDLAMRSPEMATVEYRIVRPDGAVRWMRACGRMSARSRGQAAQLMGIVADITGRKHAELEKAELRKELSHVTRVYTLGELASSMAHELNQPLGAIIANADAAEIHAGRPQPDLAEIQSILDDIRRDGLRAGDTIHRMRAFLQRREIDLQPIDVEQLLCESMKFVDMDASVRKIAVQLHVEPGLPPGCGDRTQMQQVLLNLMINGMDAMNETPESGRRLFLSARQTASDTLEISVSDKGHGIPPDKIAEVFQPFFTTKRSGLGMGLAISRSIVEAHGGRLWLENNPQGGATARFTLPMAAKGGRR